MGMYTALSLGVELNIEQGSEVAQLLNYMVNGTEPEKKDINWLASQHAGDTDLFECDRWAILLRCDSYYFDFQTHFELRWDDISNSYYLSGVSNLKNYSGEIKKFLDWLNPYIDPSVCGFIGWTMYEEDFAPELIMREHVSGQEEKVIHYVPTEAHVEATIRPTEVNDAA